LCRYTTDPILHVAGYFQRDGAPNYEVYQTRVHSEHVASVKRLTELQSPFEDTDALLKPFELIKNNGVGHGFLIAIAALKRAGNSRGWAVQVECSRP
jgi:hypothetical protein